jgi:hypothetical protein
MSALLPQGSWSPGSSLPRPPKAGVAYRLAITAASP